MGEINQKLSNERWANYERVVAHFTRLGHPEIPTVSIEVAEEDREPDTPGSRVTKTFRLVRNTTGHVLYDHQKWQVPGVIDKHLGVVIAQQGQIENRLEGFE